MSEKRKSKTRVEGHYYTLYFSQLEDEEIRVKTGGYEEIPPGGQVHREDLDSHVIEYIRRGQGKLVTEDQVFPLRSDSVFYFEQQVPYRVQNSSKNPLFRYFVNFEGQDANALLDQSALREHNPLQIGADKSIQNLFEQFHRLKDAQIHAERISELLVEQLILQISEAIAKCDEAKNPSFETYRKCRHHIETQYLYIDSLSEAAANCGVAPEHLCRLFKRYDKTSPYKLLLNLKMQKAAWLLTHSDKLVKQVAMELGYSNPFHFSRIFKTHYGVSPQAFLKQRRS